MDIVEQLSRHINDLVLLGKKYSNEVNIDELERETVVFTRNFANYHPRFFDGQIFRL